VLFPILGASDYFYATLVSTDGTREIVKVTARASDAMTIVRSQEGTLAQSFAAGSRIELRITAASITDMIAEHDQASEITFAPTGGISAANVQAAIAELDSEAAKSATLAASGGASLVGYLPTGGISAANVQAAIAELDSEAAKSVALAASGGAALVGSLSPVASSVARTVSGKLAETQSVKDFGAVGDGATNDATALQTAFTWVFGGNNRTLTFPPGSYICNGNLSVTIASSIENVHIQAYGARIVFGDSTNRGIRITTSAGGDLKRWSINDLFLEGGTDTLTLTANSTTQFIRGFSLNRVRMANFIGDGIRLIGNVFECTINGHDLTSTSLAQPVNITASAAAGVLTVTAAGTNTIQQGMSIGGINDARINGAQLSGTPGGIGTYPISDTSTVASRELTLSFVAFPIHLKNESGIISSVDVIGGVIRGGINNFLAESPVQDFNIFGGTYLQALRYGAVFGNAQGVGVYGPHIEAAWMASDLTAGPTGKACLYVAGSASVHDLKAVSVTEGNARYALEAFPGARDIIVNGGVTTGGQFVKFGLYGSGTGGMVLIGAGPQDADAVSGSFKATFIGETVSPTQFAPLFRLYGYFASITPDLDTGSVIQVQALTGNITINNPTNRAALTAGTNTFANEITVILQQDGTGGRTVTWDSDFGTTTAIAAAAGSYSIWKFVWSLSKWRQVSFSSGF
jgi:hypothetical protein